MEYPANYHCHWRKEFSVNFYPSRLYGTYAIIVVPGTPVGAWLGRGSDHMRAFQNALVKYDARVQ